MLKLLLDLYISFFKIGLFGFGGGYAMISLIQKELARYGWLNMEEFIDVLAIAQMTPGPIAINSGTFVGFRVSTILGALTATIAVITPSFFLVLLLTSFYNKIKTSALMGAILKYLRPTIIGLILTASLTIAKTSIVDFSSAIIAISVVTIMFKTNIHPIFVIVLSGILGVIIY